MLPNPLPQLADDPSGRSLGLQLPPGSVLDTPEQSALLWCADEPAAPDSWSRLLPARMAAGLQPVLLDLEDQPLEEWELDPDAMSYPGEHDPDEVLAELWECDEDFVDEDWPGLAPAQELTQEPAAGAEPDARATEIAAALVRDKWSSDLRPALVHARRSADIPAAIGWYGPVNHEGDVARLSAVLRSWEDRFGVRVVAVGFDQLVVSVGAPPTTLDDAEAVAAEHYAFCPDNITQGDRDYDTLRAYAEHAVVGKDFWRFWWD
ncbi:MAG: hypothetical protein QOF84_5685 [Streptomyces sp.]|nr:hypothetical protein [Streptomyces sp.]